MEEIVKYDNRINSIKFDTFKATDFDIFYTLCARANDKGADMIEISFADLRKIAKLKHFTNREIGEYLDELTDKLMKVNSIKNEDMFKKFVLFDDFEASISQGILRYSVNERYVELLNNLTKEYTIIEIKELTSLSSKYSKILYNNLRQFRTTGKFVIGIAELRELMNCPGKYNNKQFIQNCLNPAIEELKSNATEERYFQKLELKIIRANTQGRPISKLEFSFKKAKEIYGQMKFEVPDKAKKNPMVYFDQRDYDMEDLEKRLLRRGNKQ